MTMDLEHTPSFSLFGKAVLPGHCLNGFLACTPSKAVLSILHFCGFGSKFEQVCPTAEAWPVVFRHWAT